MVCSKYKNQPVELSFFFVLFSRGQSIAFKWNGKKDGRRIRPSSNKSLNKTTQEQGQEMHQPHHHQHRHQQHFDYSDCDKRPGGHETVSFNSSKKCKKGIGIIAFSEMVFFHCNFILYNFSKSTIFSISAHCWCWGWANSLGSTYKVWHWGYWDNMHLNQTGVSIISTSSITSIGIQQLHILFYFFHFLAMCIYKWCVCKYYNVLNRSINVFWLVQDRSIRLAMYVMYNRFENIFTETHFPQQAIISFTK